jgi:DNA-binding CsgD family transcriptional regulator
MDGVHPSSGDSPTPRHRIGRGAGGTSCRVWPRALAETWTAAGVREATADPCSPRARLARRCSIVGCGAPDRCWARANSLSNARRGPRRVDRRGRTIGMTNRAAVLQRPTRRQLETLVAYIGAGSSASAAHELGISETTVRQHLSGLYRRTGCLNAAQAAYRLGSGEWHVARSPLASWSGPPLPASQSSVAARMAWEARGAVGGAVS